MNNRFYCVFLWLAMLVATGCGNDKPSIMEENDVISQLDGPVKLALVQMNVVGGELDLNLRHAAERIAEAASEGAHLAFLPEVMDLGWTHPSAKTKAYPVPGGKTFEHLAAAARQNQIYVVAGIVEKDGDKTYNSAVLIGPDGKLMLKHRKLNELDIAHDLYDTGDRLNVCHTELGTIGLMVCADAGAKEFAVQRSLGYMGADMILSPSSWAVVADHNNEKDPYGDTWRNNYKPVARDGNEVLQAPYGADADTIIYLDAELRERPARGSDWNEYWNKEK